MISPIDPIVNPTPTQPSPMTYPASSPGIVQPMTPNLSGGSLPAMNPAPSPAQPRPFFSPGSNSYNTPYMPPHYPYPSPAPNVCQDPIVSAFSLASGGLCIFL